jgi:hypothetical protein
MLRRPEPCKSWCPPRLSIANDQETKALSKKRTTVGCSCGSTGGSVIKLLRRSPAAPSGTTTAAVEPTVVASPDVLDNGDLLEDGVLRNKKEKKKERTSVKN